VMYIVPFAAVDKDHYGDVGPRDFVPSATHVHHTSLASVRTTASLHLQAAVANLHVSAPGHRQIFHRNYT